MAVEPVDADYTVPASTMSFSLISSVIFFILTLERSVFPLEVVCPLLDKPVGSRTKNPSPS